MEIGVNLKEMLESVLEDEYIKDNMVYCKKCKTARFGKIILSENEIEEVRYVRIQCECQVKEEKEFEAKRKRKEWIAKFKERQKCSMIGNRYLDARFGTAIITNSNKEVYQSCRNYVKHAKECLEHSIGLYIYGNNSTGKTHLTACMCNALVESGYSCLYTSVPKIIAEIQSSYSNNTALGQAQIIEMISKKNFVFIDDLGKEFLGGNTGFAEKILLELLNARNNNGLPTIFSSNYSLNDFITKFNIDKAIIERVNEMSTRVLKLEGDNFRQMSIKSKNKIAESLGI